MGFFSSSNNNGDTYGLTSEQVEAGQQRYVASIICTTMDLKCDYDIIGVEEATSIMDLKKKAKLQDADAIIGLRMAGGSSYRYCYGTLVKFIKR